MPFQALSRFLVLLSLFLSKLAIAGIPTYIVYFDGGGLDQASVVAHNTPDIPAGACGMRIKEAHVLEYYWAEYNAFGLGQPMSVPPAGPPNSQSHPPGNSFDTLIEFTGPYGDNCGEETIFNVPLTGAHPTFPNGTPSGAGALVFQVYDDDDIDWLTESFTIWEPPGEGPGGPDPEPPEECDLFPDLCEPDPREAACSLFARYCDIEPILTFELPCHTTGTCHVVYDHIIDILRQQDRLSIVMGELKLSHLLIDDEETRNRALRDAVAKVAALRQQYSALDIQTQALIESLAGSASKPDVQRQLNALRREQALANFNLVSCQRGLVNTRTPLSDRNLVSCRAAEASLSRLSLHLMGFVPGSAPAGTASQPGPSLQNPGRAGK